MDSFLGLRGVRVLLKNTKILETQLKVFLRLSQNYKINVLIPMVIMPDEIIMIRSALQKMKQKLGNKKQNYNVKLGSMIEIPAAVIKINDILRAYSKTSV